MIQKVNVLLTAVPRAAQLQRSKYLVTSHPRIRDFASPLAPRVAKKDQKLASPTPSLPLRDAAVLMVADWQRKLECSRISAWGHTHHEMRHCLVVSGVFIIDRRREAGRRGVNEGRRQWHGNACGPRAGDALFSIFDAPGPPKSSPADGFFSFCKPV